MTRYYDLVLGSIPVALFGIPGTFHLAGFGLTKALFLGSLITVGIIGHALFVNGPTARSSPPTSTSDDPTDTVETAAQTASD